MMEMQRLLVGMSELNERVRAAEARATDAERQAQATQQEVARSPQAGSERDGTSRSSNATEAWDRRVRVEVPASTV